jgi:hypothetical protein
MYVRLEDRTVAPIPAFDSAVIILLSVLLPAACWLGIDRSAAPNDRGLVSSMTAVLLACWTLTAFILCIAGAFEPTALKIVPGRSNAVPLLGTAMLIFLVLFFAVGPFRRTLDAVPHTWLVGVQIGRLVGFLVLSFGLAGIIPMSFAGPAGWGDGITGLFAPVVALMLYKRVPGALLAALIWNAWGLGDLINVARLASLTTPGTSMFDPALGNNSNFALFPTGLLQALYGPIYVLLHVFSIRALVRRALRRDDASQGVLQSASS